MNVSASIPTTVHIRRSRLLGLVAGAAAVASAITWAALTFAVDGSSSSSSSQALTVGAQSHTTYSLPIPSTIVTPTTGDPGYSLPIPGVVVTRPSLGSSLTEQQRYVGGISSLTPLERAAAFGGTGSVGALELGPQGRRFVERIMSLTPRERAAAFGQ